MLGVSVLPRPDRKKSDNKIYHTVVTGINGNDIFIDNDDRVKYLDILRHKSLEKKFIVYAYCLMPNHVHILINEGALNISLIMKSINTAYAYYFNGKYNRKGSLFHDRYKSEPIENIELSANVSFIHNNPLKAGLVDDINQYPWSSANLYLKWQDSKNADINIKGVYEILNNNEKASKSIVFCNFKGNQSSFLECYNYENRNKIILSEEEANQYIIKFLDSYNICLEDVKENKEIRDMLIKQLKLQSNLSIREIAKLLNINRGIVQRCQPLDIS